VHLNPVTNEAQPVMATIFVNEFGVVIKFELLAKVAANDFFKTVLICLAPRLAPRGGEDNSHSFTSGP